MRQTAPEALSVCPPRNKEEERKRPLPRKKPPLPEELEGPAGGSIDMAEPREVEEGFAKEDS